MANKIWTIIIVTVILLIIFAISTTNIFADTKRMFCKKSSYDEIDRLKSIACGSSEYQTTYDVLNLKELDCVESIYYNKYGQLCYKFTGDVDPECDTIKCGNTGAVEFIGFEEEKELVKRSIKKEIPVIITQNRISLYPCTGKMKLCNEPPQYQSKDECLKLKGCGWMDSPHVGEMCYTAHGRPDSCEYIDKNYYDENYNWYKKKGLDLTHEEMCEHEGCIWIGE